MPDARASTANASIIENMLRGNRRLWGISSARRILLAVCMAGSLDVSVAAKDFVKPVPHPAKTYPAHDDHAAEKIAIAADPYDTPDKAGIFSVNFSEHGFLPVFFVVTNDGDQPVSIAKLEVTLITRNRSKLTPTSPDDLYRRLSNPQANTGPSKVPLPFP